MSTVVCTHEVLFTTIDILRRIGEHGKEGIVLWLATGTLRAPAPIVEVYKPDQIADVDYFRLPPASMRTLLDHLMSTRRRIVAQIHTHPAAAFHSTADAQWSIVRHVGALSLVLPRFAATTTSMNFLQEVMTYEFTSNGEWSHCSNVGPCARIMVTA